MPVETGTYISDLNATNPAHSDGLTQGDAHLRFLKSTIKTTFPNISGVVSATHTQLTNLANGLIGLANGSNIAPSLSFTTDGSIGLYRKAAGVLGTPAGFAADGAYSGGTGQLVPTGAIIAMALLLTPTGYLLCNGQAVSRTTFSTLFAAIGTAYGAGDGSTTFNVPNLNDRYLRGASAGIHAPGEMMAASVGDHTHHYTTDNPGNHSHGGATRAGDPHQHTTYQFANAAFASNTASVNSMQGGVNFNVLLAPHVDLNALATGLESLHTHPITADGGHTHSGNTDSNSVGAENRPASAVVAFYIKT